MLTSTPKITLLIYFELLMLLGVNAQPGIENIKTRFDTYRTHNLTEKLFFHLDRSSYLSGETIWFKAYCVDGTLHKPLSLSQVLYAELIDSKGTPVIQTKVRLSEQGIGFSSMELPLSLPSGNYVFRAYTNWMKNFSEEFFFNQQIVLINPFVPLDTAVQVSKLPAYDFQLFPEGGDLVEGLNSRVAFRCVDTSGEGTNFTGTIVSEKGDTVRTFAPDVYGLGSFIFTPQTGNNYRAIINHGNNAVTVHQLPRPKVAGYVLRVSDTYEKALNITVTRRGVSDNNAWLFIQTRNVIDTVLSLNFRNDSVSISLDRSMLPEGISQITLFDYGFRPVCERLIFKEIISRFEIETTTQKTFSTRSKVTLNVTASSGNTNEPLNTILSAAVFRADSIVAMPVPDITTYLKVLSDLVGRIEHPEFYFRNGGRDNLKQIEYLMLTHGWRRFNWEAILSMNEGDYQHKFVAERSGHILQGRLLTNQANTPVQGEYAYVSVPYLSSFKILKTDGDGQFMTELKYIGSSELVIQSKGENQHFELLSPFSGVTKNYYTGPFSLSRTKGPAINTRSVHMQVASAFQKRIDTAMVASPSSVMFFGDPDRRYELDDYTRFPTIEEVLREYVPEVAVRKTKGNFRLQVLNPLVNVLYNDAPLLLIDGTPHFDVDEFMQIDPLLIKSLEVVSRQYYYRGLSFGGVISFSTYQHNRADFDIPTSHLAIEYENFAAEKEFFQPVYVTREQVNSKMPDTRWLLNWEPNLSTDGSGKAMLEFYTSDIEGTYKVIIQGITSDGLTGSHSTTFDVTSRKD